MPKAGELKFSTTPLLTSSHPQISEIWRFLPTRSALASRLRTRCPSAAVPGFSVTVSTFCKKPYRAMDAAFDACAPRYALPSFSAAMTTALYVSEMLSSPETSPSAHVISKPGRFSAGRCIALMALVGSGATTSPRSAT